MCFILKESARNWLSRVQLIPAHSSTCLMSGDLHAIKGVLLDEDLVSDLSMVLG
jgi:hypothetical protein